MSSQTLDKLAPKQRLSAARVRAAQLMPYFRAGIQSLVPREVAGLGTLGVTEKSILMVDYEVLGQMTVDEAAAVLIHEYLHVFFKHSERFRTQQRAGILDAGDGKIWNEACDAEINDNLIEANLQLPKLGGGEPITPAGLGMPVNRTAEEYVAELKRRKQKEPPGGGEQGEAPAPGWGQCGSGAGNPLPGEPNAQDPAGRSPIEQEMQRRQDSEQVGQAQRGRGNVPSGIARAAHANLEPAKINWQDKLSAAVRSAVAAVSGSSDYTFTARSRMQSTMELMLGEDAPVLPGEHSPLAEVAFVIDASGSMGPAQLNPLVTEASAVLKHMGGARITFVSFDAVVHTMERVSSVQQILDGIKGGGGTDFCPVFEALDAATPRPNVVVFATDGYGPAPAQALDGMKTVWLIIDGQEPCTWGEFVHIKSDPNAEEAA